MREAKEMFSVGAIDVGAIFSIKSLALGKRLLYIKYKRWVMGTKLNTVAKGDAFEDMIFSKIKELLESDMLGLCCRV